MKERERSRIAVFIAFIMTTVVAALLLSGCGNGGKKENAAEPGTPDIVVKYEPEENVIVVNIDKTEDADGYKIYLKSEFDSKYESVMTVDEDGSEKRTAYLPDVQRNVSYSVKVKAYKKTDDGKTYGEYSKEGTVITLNDLVVIPEPTIVAAEPTEVPATATVTPEPTATAEPTAAPAEPTAEPTAAVVEPTAAPAEGVSVVLGDYKNITVKAMNDSEFDEALHDLLKSNATIINVDGPAQNGDTVNINYQGLLDGVAFEGGTDDSAAGTDLELGSHRFIEGFEENLIGAMAGESRDLYLSFPEYYPNNPDLAGKPVVFKVTVNSITRPVLPELNDEFAKSVGYSDVSVLKELYRSELDVQSFREQITEQLFYSSEVTNVPEDEVKAVADAFYNSYYDYISSLADLYGMDMDTVVSLTLGFSSMAEFRAYADQYALNTQTIYYIFKEIAKVEGLWPSEEEYSRRAYSLSRENGYDSVEAFIAENGEDNVTNLIITDIVLGYLIDKVKITY